MNRQRFRLLSLGLFLSGVLSVTGLAQVPLRLAVVDFKGDETGAVTALLRKLAQVQPTDFELLEPELIRAAAQGAKYAGGLNLQREEARALGLSLGCDYFWLGKVQIGRRQGEGQRQYFEALLGLFTVETRTGRLVAFNFFREEAATEVEARQRLSVSIQHSWSKLAAALFTARDQHRAEVAQAGFLQTPLIEVLNDDQLGQGAQQPIFYQRFKPEYTQEAEWAGITATVELEAVFQADGRVGDVQVTRWAGFGLDEVALATVRKLRFKPAQQAGKEVTIRGLVRYNFRRSLSLAERQDEAERLKRSLRELKNSGVIVPPRDQ